MTARLVLDYIGLPASAPGSLECRLRRVHYRDDGSVIDDGTRSGDRQLGCHRFVLSAGDDIDATIALAAVPGYAVADTALLRLVAAHEWRPEVLAARRDALAAEGPRLRLMIRAIGFDVAGAGELAIGFSKAIVAGPQDIIMSGKSSIKLLPGDPLNLAIDAIRARAANVDFEPPAEAELGLIRHVADALWTPERIARREQHGLDWQRITPVPLPTGRAPDFADRLQPLGDWQPIPPQPQLARFQ